MYKNQTFANIYVKNQKKKDLKNRNLYLSQFIEKIKILIFIGILNCFVNSKKDFLLKNCNVFFLFNIKVDK